MDKRFKCLVCGYIHTGINPPSNCPVCGVTKDEFIPIETPKAVVNVSPEFWRCINCEYIHKGATPPDVCPICGVAEKDFEPFTKTKLAGQSKGNMEIVIIGAGVAGITAAQTIRENSFDSKITIISNENRLPYYRLNLSRFIAKEVTEEELNICPSEWYEKNKIELKLNHIAKIINSNEKKILLNNNEVLKYDKLIIAMGAHPYVPPIKGVELNNVIQVRKFADAEFILNNINSHTSFVCIGGGILGLEIAGAIAKSGGKVKLLEGSKWLMPRQLNQKAAMILKNHIENLGVEIFEEAKINEINGIEKCSEILLENGLKIKADIVIITTGVRPNSYLVRKADLIVDKGLVVDHYMQTSGNDIFAAGDITEHYGQVCGLWNIAQQQGNIAALNAIGIKEKFKNSPRSNILKVLNFDMFSIGDINPQDASFIVLEKALINRYYYFVIQDGKIVGSVILGDSIIAAKVKQAVLERVDFPQYLYQNIDELLRSFV